MKRIFFLASLLFFCSCLTAAETKVKSLKVLMIGNSFSRSVFTYLPGLARASGKHLLLDGAMIGGCSLERHVQEFEKSEKDPAYKPYAWFQKHGKKNLKEKLSEQKWDIVTIQQSSPLSWRADSYHPWIDRLVGIIRKYAPQAEIVLQQTWAYRTDAGNFAEWKLDQKKMFELLTANYEKEAKAFRFRMIPVGYAVQLARETQKVKYVPPAKEELSKLKKPELPKQDGSLIRGYSWNRNKKTGKDVLRLDPIHLNRRGEYLQACVWYRMLFGEEPSAEFQPEGVTKEDAAFLREVTKQTAAAHGVVR